MLNIAGYEDGGPATPLAAPADFNALPGSGLGATYELLIPEAFRR